MTPKERELERRVALMELERDWEKERETYLIYHRHRHRKTVEPQKSTGTCLFAAVLYAGIVLTPLVTGYAEFAWVTLLIGGLLLFPAILSGLSETRKAEALARAKERYEERRAALLSDGVSATMRHG